LEEKTNQILVGRDVKEEEKLHIGEKDIEEEVSGTVEGG
jgi:hypothetical protein